MPKELLRTPDIYLFEKHREDSQAKPERRMHQRTSIQVAPCVTVLSAFSPHARNEREERGEDDNSCHEGDAMLYAIIIRGFEDRVRYVRGVFIGEWGGS